MRAVRAVLRQAHAAVGRPAFNLASCCGLQQKGKALRRRVRPFFRAAARAVPLVIGG
jgi:hypothetical protein